MKQFLQIETERLLIGKILFTDIDSIVLYANNKKLSEKMLTFPFPYTEENAVWWINNSYESFKAKSAYIFAIRRKENNAFIGGIGLHLDTHRKAELGYWIAEPFWNKGFATEAVNAIVQFGFETLSLNKIFALHFEDNPSSGKVLQKNNFSNEGFHQQHYFVDNVYKNAYSLAITKEEYLRMK